MISKIVATSAAVLLLACAPEEPPGVDESSGAEAPPGEELPSSCQPGTGATGAPQSIAEVVDLVNSLPRPVTLECFLESLQRPLRMEAAVSTVSAQLSLGSRSPRIFLFSGPLILTLAPEGLGAHLLEMGELVDDLRSLKAEIEFPVEDELTQEAPYETVLFTEDRLTTCALCHAEEVEVPGTPKRFTSLALRPSTGALVNLEWLEMEYAICDHEAEPERCSFFEALFGPGQVEHQSFPSEFGSFGI